MNKKICFLATVPSVINFFIKDHIINLSKFSEITIITNDISKISVSLKKNNIKLIQIKIDRKTSFFYDILLLLNLIFIFKKNKFYCVHSFMPKTGFVGMLAAFILFIPVRIHTFTGQIWTTMNGPKRFFFKLIDKLIYSFSSLVLVDSNKQIEYLINNLNFKLENIAILHKGGITGIDGLIYNKNIIYRNIIRKKFNIPKDNIVFIFVGRLNKDKGIIDLLDSYKIFINNSKSSNSNLFIIGDDEENIFDTHIKGKYFSKFIRYVPFSDEINKFLAASDIFCLPSYREGFGNAVLEASCSSLPIIVSDIYGLQDVAINNFSGFTIPPGNLELLSSKMNSLYKDNKLRNEFGKNGRHHALENFSSSKIQSSFISLYKKLNII